MTFADFTQWKNHGQKLATKHSKHQWLMAEWILAGEEHFGDQNPYDTAAEITGYARLTLQNWASVVRNISIRIESLSFGHHQVVASMDAAEQKEWLERAVAETWSVKRLHTAIADARAAEVETETTETATETSSPKKSQMPTDAFYKALSFVPTEDKDSLQFLARARRTRPEDLVVHAIRELTSSAADEIAREREAHQQRSKQSKEAIYEWVRRDNIKQHAANLLLHTKIDIEREREHDIKKKVEAMLVLEIEAREEARKECRNKEKKERDSKRALEAAAEAERNALEEHTANPGAETEALYIALQKVRVEASLAHNACVEARQQAEATYQAVRLLVEDAWPEMRARVEAEEATPSAPSDTTSQSETVLEEVSA